MSQTTPTAPTDATSSGNHRSNYTAEEDIQLCKSYLAISVDPNVGTEQKADELWAAIKEHFDNARRGLPGYVERFGLKARWTTINRLVSKYLGHYMQATRINASGTDGFDLVTKANELYHAESVRINRKPSQFSFMHCWSILESSPKWNHKVRGNATATSTSVRPAAASASTSAGSSSVSSSSAASNSSGSINEDDGASRPIGNKRSKGKRRQDAIVANSTEELNKTMTNSLKEWSSTNEAKRRALEVRNNDTIMSRNIASISDPLELEYFQLRRKEILADLKMRLLRERSAVVEEVEEVEVLVVPESSGEHAEEVSDGLITDSNDGNDEDVDDN